MLNVNFSPFPILTTERLLLREMTPADAPGVLRLRSSKEVMKYINRPLALTLSDAEAWINVVVSTLQKDEGITWCMALREKPSEFIGSIGLWRIEKENYRAEIGYMLDPSFQGQGIMSEAIQKVVTYGFEQMKLHTIEGCIDPRNIASGRVLEKSGFVQEAYFKENYYLNGGFADTAVYSALSPYPHVSTVSRKELEENILS
ncbi:MAG: N-acetyltransferase [Chitinophagaceae bacterium]|nr:MAG: N-acetyltransferase [Chitinophagaceae bacterium]